MRPLTEGTHTLGHLITGKISRCYNTSVGKPWATDSEPLTQVKSRLQRQIKKIKRFSKYPLEPILPSTIYACVGRYRGQPFSTELALDYRSKIILHQQQQCDFRCRYHCHKSTNSETCGITGNTSVLF